MYRSNNTNFSNKTQYELIVDGDTFKKYLDKQMNCKFLISSNDVNFKEILMNENVVNQSFSFANEVLKKSQSSHYIMIQFLLAMILITIVFAYVVNSITMNNEKKKIGIKYSFGIKKKDIVIPYVLELVIYIILGLVISLLLTKVVYPIITNGLIYTTSQEIKENYFFYIGWLSIFGWDALIYAIMTVSLLIMVYKICKKSPIEIIKDL